MMRKAISLLAVVAIMGLSGCGDDNSQPTPPKGLPTPTTQPTSGADHDALDSLAGSVAGSASGVCPLSGEKVDPKVKAVNVGGKDYGFCCDDCKDKFKANPSKYVPGTM